MNLVPIKSTTSKDCSAQCNWSSDGGGTGECRSGQQLVRKYPGPGIMLGWRLRGRSEQDSMHHVVPERGRRQVQGAHMGAEIQPRYYLPADTLFLIPPCRKGTFCNPTVLFTVAWPRGGAF